VGKELMVRLPVDWAVDATGLGVEIWRKLGED